MWLRVEGGEGGGRMEITDMYCVSENQLFGVWWVIQVYTDVVLWVLGGSETSSLVGEYIQICNMSMYTLYTRCRRP